MATFKDAKDILEGLKYADLIKAQDYIEQLMGEAKKSDFIEAFLGSDKTVYVNKAKGKGEDYQKARIVGVEENGIIVKDWNDPEARKVTVKWSQAKTKEEMTK